MRVAGRPTVVILVRMHAIPQARVVRQGTQRMAPPPAPREEDGGLLRQALVVAVGMWPLTAVMLLALGLLVMAANGGNY